MSQQRLAELLQRYEHYTGEGIATKVLPAYNREWLTNALALVPMESPCLPLPARSCCRGTRMSLWTRWTGWPRTCAGRW